MPNDFITIAKTNRTSHGANAIRLANLLREVRDLCDAESDAVGRMHDGVTYTTVEANFSLAGGGANFATLVGLLNEILNTNTEVTGANRLARLDEFVSRLAGQ